MDFSILPPHLVANALAHLSLNDVRAYYNTLPHLRPYIRSMIQVEEVKGYYLDDDKQIGRKNVELDAFDSYFFPLHFLYRIRNNCHYNISRAIRFGDIQLLEKIATITLAQNSWDSYYARCNSLETYEWLKRRAEPIRYLEICEFVKDRYHNGTLNDGHTIDYDIEQNVKADILSAMLCDNFDAYGPLQRDDALKTLPAVIKMNSLVAFQQICQNIDQQKGDLKFWRQVAVFVMQYGYLWLKDSRMVWLTWIHSMESRWCNSDNHYNRARKWLDKGSIDEGMKFQELTKGRKEKKRKINF